MFKTWIVLYLIVCPSLQFYSQQVSSAPLGNAFNFNPEHFFNTFAMHYPQLSDSFKEVLTSGNNVLTQFSSIADSLFGNINLLQNFIDEFVDTSSDADSKSETDLIMKLFEELLNVYDDSSEEF
ncbi:PREDICTED: uncharacterized protein LOC108354049 isoform X1 [Rhagoletis zephyria]|uniref:uncharacterized protein LOC108354049 isoform X1 n=1 Tax=Rhagoletis zephyria TaxID=28612 RepID=UPI000811AA1C|nr:PREDICTED: uncharacterized protein LOC108354049 isoform X1 [Rhagoletis zephyria]